MRALRSSCCGATVWGAVLITGYCSGCFSPTTSGGCWVSTGKMIKESDWIEVAHHIPAVRNADKWQPLKELQDLLNTLPIALLFEDRLGNPPVPALLLELHKGIPFLTVSTTLLKEWNIPKTISTVGELKALLRLE